MRFFLLSVLLSSVCLSVVLCADDTTTITTEASSTTVSTTVAVNTTTTADVTTTTPATTSTTTTPATTSTTTTPATTSTTTTPATTTIPASTTTTTTPSPDVPVLKFRIPKNENETACLRAQMTLQFAIKYTAEVNGTKTNETVNVELKELAGYEGECQNSYETLTVDFKAGWSLEFNYTLESNSYFELNSLNFKYVVDAATFPNVTESELGPKSVMLQNQSFFSANKGNSYKCYSETNITLSDNVVMEISKYQAQSFLDSKNSGFDTAIECSADTTGTSKLVPIIVGASLAALVIMVLVAYIIGRRKHRPGYQQV